MNATASTPDTATLDRIVQSYDATFRQFRADDLAAAIAEAKADPEEFGAEMYAHAVDNGLLTETDDDGAQYRAVLAAAQKWAQDLGAPAECTFPDTTDCTGEHYCEECGTHLDSDGVCPAGCDPEAEVDERVVALLRDHHNVHASLDFNGVARLTVVPDRLHVTTAINGWTYGSLSRFDGARGAWVPLDDDPSYDWPDVVSEDERDPAVIAAAWAAWVARRAAVEV